jgi:putative SOS response-associated peptidase YedK
MCGRYGFTRPKKLQPEWFGLKVIPELKPRYNVAPSQSIAAVRDGEQGRELCFLKWGMLLPEKVRDQRPKSARNTNVRSDKIFWTYPDAFEHRRCIILADCIFEWKTLEEKSKQPYCIRMADASFFAMAGLWENDALEGGTVQAGAIITTSANEQMSEVHDRMPVILSTDNFAAWLDPSNHDTKALHTLLKPYTGKLEIFPVSKMLNNPRNDDPRLLESAA